MSKLNVDELLAKYELKKGTHKNLDEGACVMELVSYIANEPWSYKPECACPVLTEFAVTLNDVFSDTHRQMLKPVIPLLLNSRINKDVTVARRELISWRYLTVVYPIILDNYKLTEIAAKLRTFKNNFADMSEAKKFLIDNEDAIRHIDHGNIVYAYSSINSYVFTSKYTLSSIGNPYAYSYEHGCSYLDFNRQNIVELAIETLKLAAAIKADVVVQDV